MKKTSSFKKKKRKFSLEIDDFGFGTYYFLIKDCLKERPLQESFCPIDGLIYH